jgi:Uma2 family endonuclease
LNIVFFERYMENVALKLTSHLKDTFTDDEFYEFCQMNSELKFERDRNGNILLMALTGGETGRKNTNIIIELGNWAKRSGSGIVFDSSTGFKLPNKSNRSPDAAWVSNEKWNRLSKQEKEKYPPLCPEFVVELMSESDTLKEAKEKMEEYIENGCQLGWLIAPQTEEIHIYRANKPVQIVTGFNQKISGESVLRGFEFDCAVLK